VSQRLGRLAIFGASRGSRKVVSPLRTPSATEAGSEDRSQPASRRSDGFSGCNRRGLQTFTDAGEFSRRDVDALLLYFRTSCCSSARSCWLSTRSLSTWNCSAIAPTVRVRSASDAGAILVGRHDCQILRRSWSATRIRRKPKSPGVSTADPFSEGGALRGATPTSALVATWMSAASQTFRERLEGSMAPIWQRSPVRAS
jgi:hypothetical protein